MQLSVLVAEPAPSADDRTKAWAESHLTPVGGTTGQDPALRDSVLCTVMDRGRLVLLTSSHALLRMSASLLPRAFDTGQAKKKKSRAEDPAVAALKKLEARVARCSKAVEDRQQDFERENTERCDVDPNDEVCVMHI